MLLSLTDIEPIPCPRPRISRFGAYYPATYRIWKKKADAVVRGAVGGIPDHRPLDFPLDVWLLFAVRKPKKTKLLVPKPDIDNYMKAIFDACNGIVWQDDSLVVKVTASKMWAEVIKPGIYMMVSRNDGEGFIIPETRTLPEVRQQGRSGPIR